MNLLDAFTILEEFYIQESFNDREKLIAEITNAGYRYNFDKYTNRQLFHIRNWAISQATKQSKKPLVLDWSDLALELDYDYCENCGRELNPLGECPTCDLGDDSAFESLNNSDELSF
jgi:hypothetical protein